MRRRDRSKAHHPHGAQKRLRRQKRRRRVRSMLLTGAAFVAPSAGTLPPVRSLALAPEAITQTVQEVKGVVTTSEAFRLLPEAAFEELIHEAAARYSLSPALIRAVIRAESAFDPLAVSRVGAQGLMQLMPALASEMGVADSFDPRENIMAGTRYLSALIADQNGDLALALASYNAGPGAVERYQGIPPFKETQRYVKTILESIARSEDPPD